MERFLSGARYEEKTKNLLRAVLVDGVGVVDAGKQFGVTKQRVNQVIDLFLERHYSSAENSLVSVTTEIPERLADELVKMTAALKASDASDIQKSLAIEKAIIGIRNSVKFLSKS